MVVGGSIQRRATSARAAPSQSRTATARSHRINDRRRFRIGGLVRMSVFLGPLQDNHLTLAINALALNALSKSSAYAAASIPLPSGSAMAFCRKARNCRAVSPWLERKRRLLRHFNQRSLKPCQKVGAWIGHGAIDAGSAARRWARRSMHPDKMVSSRKNGMKRVTEMRNLLNSYFWWACERGSFHYDVRW